MTVSAFNIEDVFTIDILSTYPSFGRYGFESIHGFKTIDAVRWLDARAAKKPPVQHIPHHMGYWDAFKSEFKIFLCTKDRKYKALRSRVKKLGTAGQVATVAAISDVIAKNVGTTGIVVGTLVVVSLITVLKIGQEAYCKTIDIDSLVALPHDPPP
jgi:hypothetical protein